LTGFSTDLGQKKRQGLRPAVWLHRGTRYINAWSGC
jgi:hypothetical protein